MKTISQKILIFLVFLLLITFLSIFAQEKTKTVPEVVELAIEKIVRVPNAEIVKATIFFSATRGEGSAPAEKTQFDVILKSRLKSNNEGEIIIGLSAEEFKQIPDTSTFILKLKIKPPKGFEGEYTSDEATIKLKKKDGPIYTLIITFEQQSTKTNKGTFAVSSKAQT